MKNIDEIKQCPFGIEGVCCRMCFVGPCRVREESIRHTRGICGHEAKGIAAGNFLNLITSGAAVLSYPLKELARGLAEGRLSIRDEKKLKEILELSRLKVGEKNNSRIARELGQSLLQEDDSFFMDYVITGIKELWEEAMITPRGIDKEIMEGLYQSILGHEKNYRNILLQAFRTALASGWGASTITGLLEEIIFGKLSSHQVQLKADLLKEKEVNIAVFSEEKMKEITSLAADNQILDLAITAGAEGINVVDTSAIPTELVVATGLVETMVADGKMKPTLLALSRCYHTEIIPSVDAREILIRSVNNFANRMVAHPLKEDIRLIAEFDLTTVSQIKEKIRKIAVVIGCNNPREDIEYIYKTLFKELIANDILVVFVGCGIVGCGGESFLTVEGAEEAGSNLRNLCKERNMPPVIYSGSCFHIGRVFRSICELGLECCTCIPVWRGYQILTIGEYLVGSGTTVVVGGTLPFLGSEKVSEFLTEEIEKTLGAKWIYEPDPIEMSRIIRHSR